ncbi:MAG: hypothetical protein GF332_03560 [Candidatus Moranbacteria bacterium]|nr:hypothetical protein [Candidatus Moranbacteria bacterium]
MAKKFVQQKIKQFYQSPQTPQKKRQRLVIFITIILAFFLFALILILPKASVSRPEQSKNKNLIEEYKNNPSVQQGTQQYEQIKKFFTNLF